MLERALLVLAVMPVIACGSKAATPPADSKPSPADEARKLEPVAAQISAALPDGLKSIKFSPTVADEGRVVAVVPEGWEPGGLPGTTRPPESASLGPMTQVAVGTSCDGVCSPKDWAEAADRVDLGHLRGSDFTVVKDEAITDQGQAGAGGRVLVARTLDRTFVVVVRWLQGGSRYAFCRVTLDQEAAGAADAFEQACRGMKVLTWQ